MNKVRIVLTCGSFQFAKHFELSTVPQENWIINTQRGKEGGYVTAKVKWVGQFIDEDFITVWCSADLHSLCLLHLNNMGWKINDQAAFTSSSAAQRMFARIQAATG